MPKTDCSYVFVFITVTSVLVGLLSGTQFSDALVSSSSSNSRQKRQITYATAKAYEDEDSPRNNDEFKHFESVTLKKPLPKYSAYPGDLSSFFVIHKTPNISISENSSQLATSSSKDKKTNRPKRGAYVRDDLETKSVSAKISARKLFKSPFAESRRHESYESVDIPSEMSFNGAGYLRSEDNDIGVLPRSRNDYPPMGNRRAADDFQAAFHPEYGRDFEVVQFDDDIRPAGTLVKDKTSDELKNSGFKADSTAEMGSPSTPNFSVISQKSMSGSAESFLPTIPSQYSNIAEMNSFFYRYPFGQLATAADTTGYDIQESLLKNHRLNTDASNKRVATVSSAQKSHVIEGKSDTLVKSGKSPNRRKKRSASKLDYREDEHSSKERVSEARRDYRFSRSDDIQDSSSGFIPLSGTFEGGALHLSLPYYGGGPMSSPYSSGPPMPYNTYGPRRPQPRHYPGENYFHPSEARRYSYGILGSGNFEVIRGGIYSGQTPRGLGNTITFDDTRSPYGGEIYNSYGGATEIIIDGPVQGFQGFDNFPAHLINALSKHSEISVRGPER